MSEPTKKTCSMCARNYTGLGNNAWPINTGRCCDECNIIVTSARIRRGRQGQEGQPEWYTQLVERIIKDLVAKELPKGK